MTMYPNFDDLINEIFGDYNPPEDKVKKTNKDGMTCTKCNTINEYVTESNQDDGTYVCYKCRKF
ncbi:hypothetical protein LCGC14_0427030 [marine sediment metagenome]|uniref:Lunapark zinc ribbon domain-containing protein n=1 Tax=marine sediment metagenome TaxID=412755 RepID=A0A0F9VB97_9ZZZZ